MKSSPRQRPLPPSFAEWRDRFGTVAAGAFADLVVVDGDPLKDLSLLTNQGAHMPLIMESGRRREETI